MIKHRIIKAKANSLFMRLLFITYVRLKSLASFLTGSQALAPGYCNKHQFCQGIWTGRHYSPRCLLISRRILQVENPNPSPKNTRKK